VDSSIWLKDQKIRRTGFLRALVYGMSEGTGCLFVRHCDIHAYESGMMQTLDRA